MSLLLFAVDLLALELALWLAWNTRILLIRWIPAQLSPDQFHSMMLAVTLLPAIQALRGAYPGYGIGPVARFRDWSYAIVFFFSALTVWDYLILEGRWSHGVLIIAAVYALIILPLIESLTREILVRLGVWGTPVVIFGAAQTGHLITRLLKQNRALGLVPIAIFDDDPAKSGTNIEGIPVMGPIRIANDWANQAQIAILAMPGLQRTHTAKLMHYLKFPRIILVPDLIGLESLWVQTRDLNGILGLEVRKNFIISKNRILKRFLDYMLGIPLAILSAPLIGILALWIKWVSPGPAFYLQEREGYKGRPIKVWKLRTMYPDAEVRLERYLAEN
ncbi:MAG: exopolysaccharide biosynthesis polyprenyl glycosylphosphotransferase, partial [Gammaproteobacteria bacterium]|nr:exopolysaccharide biosynthesis polyprenyl glycosylphosphotransferase [Gammaproteobacteria bacterium]